MFVQHKRDTAGVLPWEYLPAAAGTYQAGQMLTLANGKLAALAAATNTTPEYLCCGSITAAAGDIVPVVRVRNDTIFAAPLTAAAATATVGTKLEVSAGGLGVDGTAAGTFEVVALEGTAAGDTVYGRFA